MKMFYRLEGHTPVPVNSIMEWAEWLEKADRKVAHNTINGVEVSTAFLGIDHAFSSDRPLLFETMIFGGFYDGYQRRCSTWEDAEALHTEALVLVLRWRLLPRWAQQFAEDLWWFPVKLLRRAEALKAQMGG